MSLELKKRGNAWTYVVDVGRDPLTGKRKRTSKGGFKTKGECRTAASLILSDLEKGSYFEVSNIDFKTFMIKYLNTIEKNLAYKTFKTYKYIANYYLIPHFGDAKVKDLKPIHIQDFYSEILKNKSPTTVRHIHNFLHKSLNLAVKWQLIKTNPCDSIEKPKRVKTQMLVLNKEQLKLFLTSIKNMTIYTPVVIAAATGMRQAEICGLTWDNVDLNNKVIYVKKQLQRINAKLEQVNLKTDNSRRNITIFGSFITILENIKSRQEENKDYFKDNYCKDDYVFAQSDGRPYDPGYISRNFNRVLKEYKHKCKNNETGKIEEKPLYEILNIPPIRFHDLRHTHATILLQDKITPKAVAERLGDTVTTVMTTYAHVLPDMQKEAAEKINNIFMD